MWSVGSKNSADLYVGTKRVMYVLAEVGGGEISHVEAQSWSVDGFADALRILDEQLLAHVDGSAVKDWRVWLSAGIARPFLLEAPAKTSSSDIRRIAEALVVERVGIAEECELWIEQRQGSGAVMVVAIVKSQLGELLGRFGKGTRRRLRSMTPWWSEVLRLALRQGAGTRLVAVQDCDSLTLLTGQARAFDGVQTLSPVRDRATADAALARKRLSLGVDEREVAQFRLSANVVDRGGETSQVFDLALAPFVESLE